MGASRQDPAPGRRLVSRRAALRLAAGGSALLAAGCSGGNAAAPGATTRTSRGDPTPEGTPPPTRVPPSTTPGSSPTPTPDLSLEEKVGQMLMLGFRGLRVEDLGPFADSIASGHVGHVVLFDYDVPSDSPVRNVESPEQVAALTRGLQELAPRSLLVAIDQEGGVVARLDEDHGFPPTMSAQALGELNDLEVTRQAAREMAHTLWLAGCNLNLAPVVDVNVNPDNPVIGGLERSFSSDPAVVTAHASAFIEAHHAEGILTTLKHFPGHGSSEADSHLGFVDVTGLWSEIELRPFGDIIAAELSDCVMTAHIFDSEWDSQYPATLSQNAITGILRSELGFEGVVISDDMQMGAIREHYGFEEAIELAVHAGVDILAIANNGVEYDETVGEQAFQIVLGAVQEGRISEVRIDQSWQRISLLRRKLANRSASAPRSPR
jgi:beta-N-acetylhexosaminidase